MNNPMTENKKTPPQMFARETRFIQARDLAAFEHEHSRLGHALITVKIDGEWREVYEVWPDASQVESILGGEFEHTKEIRKWVTWASQCWVIVRHLVEEKSDGGCLEDALHRWRTCDLVEVQVPVLLLMPSADEPQQPTISPDHAHVLLDAVTVAEDLIGRGDQPWLHYDGGDDDPKLNRDGYVRLLAEASAALEKQVAEG